MAENRTLFLFLAHFMQRKNKFEKRKKGIDKHEIMW